MCVAYATIRSCHHRFAPRDDQGGYYRAGEEPKYDGADTIGAASLVEDFAVYARALADPTHQLWPPSDGGGGGGAGAGGDLKGAVLAYLDAAARGGVPSRLVRAAVGELLASRRRRRALERANRAARRRGADDAGATNGDDDGALLPRSLADTSSMLRLLRYPVGATTRAPFVIHSRSGRLCRRRRLTAPARQER